MAEKLDEFKKKFADIKAAIIKYKEAFDKNERFIGQTNGVIEEGIKELGLRIHELKDGGMTGNAIDAFMGDADVKQMMNSINSYLGGIQKELAGVTAIYNEKQKTVTAFYDLKKAVETEIAKRKQEVSTKLGTGNKSLPDMEKLFTEMKKYIDEMPYAKVEIFVPETYEEHVKQTKSHIQDEIAKSKDKALTAFQSQMEEQACNTRVLNRNVGVAKGWYETVMKECGNALKAVTERNNKNLLSAKALVIKPWNDLKNMDDMYQRAAKDEWIKSKIADSSDKGKIQEMMQLITGMRGKAAGEIAKVANAKI
jgi:hypothetical protein